MPNVVIETPGFKQTQEAAELLGMHRVTLYDWIKKLNIKPAKMGNNTLISDKDIERIRKGRDKSR